MLATAFRVEGNVTADTTPVLGVLLTAFLALSNLRGIQGRLALEVTEDRVAFLVEAGNRLSVILHRILLLLQGQLLDLLQAGVDHGRLVEDAYVISGQD